MILGLVSVIMPVYNAGPFVAEAIQSVIDQSHPDWELIIINDGSTDESEKVIKGFENPKIHCYNQTNQGVSAARNYGLKTMRGEFFCFLDADDVMPKNSIASRVTVFRNSQEVYFVDGVVKQYDQTATTLLGEWRPSFSGQPIHKLLALSSKCFYGSTWMIRRNPGQHYAFLTGVTNAEDLLFYIGIAEKGNYAFTSEDILYNRRRAASASSNLDGLASGYRLFYNKVKIRLSSNGRWYLSYRIRRIMFLSYLSKHQISKAFRFALLRKL